MTTPRPRTSLPVLLKNVRRCTICAPYLPHGAKPILQMGVTARILIAGQAPGIRAHTSGVPFDDASGDRLRQWMGIDRDVFYDADRIAILPMGFCFPGSGRSGDLPPRSECAPAWRAALLAQLKSLELTLVIGGYAQAWHLGAGSDSVTSAVRDWKRNWPTVVPLPHPSPRNRGWFATNPWFDAEVIPALQTRIAALLI